MNARKIVFRLAGVALVVCAGTAAFVACSGDDNNNPGPTTNPFDASSSGSASGSTSGSASGSATGSTSGSASGSGAGTGSGSGSTTGSTSGSATGSTSGSSSGSTGCPSSTSCTADGGADAACNSCAVVGCTDTHNTCSPYTTNCIPFTGTVPSHPTL